MNLYFQLFFIIIITYYLFFYNKKEAKKLVKSKKSSKKIIKKSKKSSKKIIEKFKGNKNATNTGASGGGFFGGSSGGGLTSLRIPYYITRMSTKGYDFNSLGGANKGNNSIDNDESNLISYPIDLGYKVDKKLKNKIKLKSINKIKLKPANKVKEYEENNNQQSVASGYYPLDFGYDLDKKKIKYLKAVDDSLDRIRLLVNKDRQVLYNVQDRNPIKIDNNPKPFEFIAKYLVEKLNIFSRNLYNLSFIKFNSINGEEIDDQYLVLLSMQFSIKMKKEGLSDKITKNEFNIITEVIINKPNVVLDKKGDIYFRQIYVNDKFVNNYAPANIINQLTKLSVIKPSIIILYLKKVDKSLKKIKYLLIKDKDIAYNPKCQKSTIIDEKSSKQFNFVADYLVKKLNNLNENLYIIKFNKFNKIEGQETIDQAKAIIDMSFQINLVNEKIDTKSKEKFEEDVNDDEEDYKYNFNIISDIITTKPKYGVKADVFFKELAVSDKSYNLYNDYGSISTSINLTPDDTNKDWKPVKSILSTKPRVEYIETKNLGKMCS